MVSTSRRYPLRALKSAKPNGRQGDCSLIIRLFTILYCSSTSHRSSRFCQWWTYSVVISPNMSMRTRKKNSCTIQAFLRQAWRLKELLSRSLCNSSSDDWNSPLETTSIRVSCISRMSAASLYIYRSQSWCEIAVDTNQMYNFPRSQFTALISRQWDASEPIPLRLSRITSTSATVVDNSIVLYWQQWNWSITNLSKTLDLYNKTHSTRWRIQNTFSCSIAKSSIPIRQSIWFARASEFVGWVCEIPNWRCALCRKEMELYKMAWIIWVHREVVFIIMEWTEHPEFASRFQTQESFPIWSSFIVVRRIDFKKDFIHQSESIIQSLPYDWRHLFLLLQVYHQHTLGMNVRIFSEVQCPLYWGRWRLKWNERHRIKTPDWS